MAEDSTGIKYQEAKSKEQKNQTEIGFKLKTKKARKKVIQ